MKYEKTIRFILTQVVSGTTNIDEAIELIKDLLDEPTQITGTIQIPDVIDTGAPVWRGPMRLGPGPNNPPSERQFPQIIAPFEVTDPIPNPFEVTSSTLNAHE